MTWEIKTFGELSTNELHDLLKTRVDVFVVEQECAYPEIDGKDPLCIHVLGKNSSGKTLATARIAPAGVIYGEVSIGRVAIDKSLRGTGVGKIVMEQAMTFCIEELNAKTIKIAAQLYLKKFYSGFGFTQISDVYLWDGIEHIDMRFPKKIGNRQ
ncbi:GNAT family N-acetyltransferase [Cryomorpha ignava]|uniref:GNAT family N-acetyltransferase n=2 Tax=Cryomorpha ignava TaxID=101383 RepID=A0A7K3WR39_9FLAO|nr:GNAT family N-acetyltransferase [Cryomorpha ignava]